MRHFIFTFIFILFSISLFGQNSEPTKEQTQDWIKSVVHSYGTGELIFENNKIFYDDPYDPMGLHLKHEALIKNLGGVTISDGTKDYKAIYLTCFEGKCVKIALKVRTDNAKVETIMNNKFMIQLNDDLPIDLEDRLIKAFNHLINLYGGKTIDNTF